MMAGLLRFAILVAALLPNRRWTIKLPWLTTLIVAAAMGIGESVADGPGPARDLDTLEAATGEHRVWGELIVRAPISGVHLDVLTDQVERIWMPYGVTLAWRPAPPVSAVSEGFSDWVRIVIASNLTNLQAGDRRRPAVAALQFMSSGTPRNVIYVSLDGAHALLRHLSGMTLSPTVQDRLVARLAGRAIAHELGHYLLRTSDHRAEGLMRPEFTRADLLDSSLTRFRLTPTDAAGLAERLSFEREAILAQNRPPE